ncbi:outer membrane homotrimeric porin [Desulfocurvus sp. DL9XJH121]
MKRFLVLALVLSFVLGATMANAKEMNFKANFEQSLEWLDNSNFFEQGDDANDGDRNSEDDFNANQRVRMYFEYVDSETLRGVVGFEIDTRWGEANGGQLGTDGVDVEVKHAYVDFNVGNVAFRTGLQPLAFPSAVAGSPIWDDDVAGIVASYKFNDMVSLTVGWARLLDLNAADAGSASTNDEIDAFTAIMPITGDGWSLTPYVVYAAIGSGGYNAADPVKSLYSENATAWGDNLDAWWGGGAFTLTMFDPFVFSADLIYGSVDGDTSDRNDRAGWFFAAELDYKMDMVTPGLVFVYGTGNDDDTTDGSEAMPNLSGGGGNFSGFGLTTMGFDGSHWTTTSGALLPGNNGNYGLWALGLTFKDFSLLENLSQTFTVVYGQGTNDADGIKGKTMVDSTGAASIYGLSDEDSFWEVELLSEYALYENLSLWSELNYVSVDLDEDTWKNTVAYADEATACARFSVGLSYNF